MQKEANSLVWGAIGAVLAAIAQAILLLNPSMEVSGNITTMSFAAVTGAGFFWGWAMAEIKNWLGRKRPRS